MINSQILFTVTYYIQKNVLLQYIIYNLQSVSLPDRRRRKHGANISPN